MIEATAKGATVEEALAAVKLKLNAPEDAEVQYEVLSQGSKKILGLFGGSPAEVRAYYVDAESEKAQKKAENKKKSNRNDKKADKKPAEKKVEVTRQMSDYTPVSADEPAVRYLRTVLENMGINAEIFAGTCDGELYINVTGDGVGAVIGHHGETLDSLQYLVSLVANRKEKSYQRVTLDSGNYREKRAEALKTLAANIASQSLKNRRNMALEPMNPYERRIIHTAVQNIDGVKSWSTGEEPSRRVVIGNDDFESVRNGGRRNDRRRGGRDRRPKRDAYVPDKSSLREKKTEHDDIALYGKIN